jgi:hypothetical protein
LKPTATKNTAYRQRSLLTIIHIRRIETNFKSYRGKGSIWLLTTLSNKVYYMMLNSRTLQIILKFIKGGLILFILVSFKSSAQKAYFIDGYHGGVYGHYPLGYTSFIVEKLKENPSWNINLEIEPETWDSVLVREPAALKELQQFFADQSTTGRIEYVSPAYGQSYLYNISGESIIRHFSYGINCQFI